MADSNATHTRTIAVDLPDYASQDVNFRLMSTVAIADSEVFPQKEYTLTLDGSGEGTIALPTPDNTGDDAWTWEITLPDKRATTATLAYAAGTLQLATWLAAAATTATASDLLNQYVQIGGDTMTGKLQFSGTDHEGVVPVSLTTAQRDAIASPGDGAIIWNSDNSRLERYTGAAWVDVADIGSYSGHINVTDAGHSPSAGDLWGDGGGALHFYPIGAERSVKLANGVVMSNVSVSNTTDETTVYTETIPANELYKGSKWHTKLSGLYSVANANDTWTARFKLGGTTIQSFSINAGIATDQFWRCEFFFTVRTTGANGTILGVVEATTGGTDHSVGTASTTTIDTTQQQDMTMTVQWDAADTNNSVTMSQGHTEIFGVKQA